MNATQSILNPEIQTKPSVPVNEETIAALVAKHGAKHREDIKRGVAYCAKVQESAGSSSSFHEFCLAHYCPPGPARSRLLRKLDEFASVVGGSFGVMAKVARYGLDVADEPLTAADELLAAFSAGTHLSEDYRKFQIAALIQLNFGTDDLSIPKNREGWAARRISNIGREVIPADLLAQASQARAEVDKFVSTFNINLDKIVYPNPAIKFPANTTQVSHWGLRDYMTGLNGKPGALESQRAIRDLMRRVVDGEIPSQIIDNPKAVWRQNDNTVTADGKTEPARMTGSLRWEKFKLGFDIARRIDPYTRYGNIIDNKFKLEREIPEETIVGALTEALSAPEALGVAKFVERSLGRKLEPHDIYFETFRDGAKRAALKLDIRKKYPTAEALTKAIPDILVKLGFSRSRAVFIGSKIRVDNSRSAGHAWSPHTPTDLQLLRVRVNKKGITEQEFGTFMHELGHCVEGVLSSYEMDFKALWSVPNTAFTEGFAFTFQDRADFVLGRKSAENQDVITLQRYWELYEIAGPALVEVRFFHWLYENPGATPADMHRRIREIGDDVWREFYARIFGPEGYGLMSVYSHILWCDFYLADYPMGYIIAYQVRKYLRDKTLSKEMERMCRLGCVYPEEWMKKAVGQKISLKPMLDDTRAALKRLKLV